MNRRNKALDYGDANFTVFTIGFLILAYAVLPPLSAQEGFGFSDEETAGDFGFGDEGTGGSLGGSGGSPVSIGGEAGASLTGFGNDFADGAKAVRLGNIFSGRLEFSAVAFSAEGVMRLKLAPGPVFGRGRKVLRTGKEHDKITQTTQREGRGKMVLAPVKCPHCG
ncbi:MAG: hypothetical protein LBT00_09250, partial [Spirochaetaceae bacterium]|nr:hypothetical protein [Spirochaetaceae bacterium]